MSDTRTENYAEALLGLARAEGAEAVVADELYRVAREIDNNVELSTNLSDLALPAALEAAAGRPIAPKFLVDPDVVGGVHAEIGDQVIDGTVRSRLAQLRELF